MCQWISEEISVSSTLSKKKPSNVWELYYMYLCITRFNCFTQIFNTYCRKFTKPHLDYTYTKCHEACVDYHLCRTCGCVENVSVQLHYILIKRTRNLFRIQMRWHRHVTCTTLWCMDVGRRCISASIP